MIKYNICKTNCLLINNFVKIFYLIKISITLFALLFLSGCTTAGSSATGIIGVATSFIMTDKLPTDNMAEIATGLDCSYVRHLDDKGPVCRSHDYGKVIEKPIYCYRTLGKVDCYDYPDPFAVGAYHVE